MKKYHENATFPNILFWIITVSNLLVTFVAVQGFFGIATINNLTALLISGIATVALASTISMQTYGQYMLKNFEYSGNIFQFRIGFNLVCSLVCWISFIPQGIEYIATHGLNVNAFAVLPLSFVAIYTATFLLVSFNIRKGFEDDYNYNRLQLAKSKLAEFYASYENYDIPTRDKLIYSHAMDSSDTQSILEVLDFFQNSQKFYEEVQRHKEDLCLMHH